MQYPSGRWGGGHKKNTLCTLLIMLTLMDHPLGSGTNISHRGWRSWNWSVNPKSLTGWESHELTHRLLAFRQCPYMQNWHTCLRTTMLYLVPNELLLYEAYANESSQICPFLALRPEFHSNLRVILSTPRYCQSATFGRLTFCVYTLLFFTEFAFNVATPTVRTPRPPRKPLCDKRSLHAEL